MYVSNLKGLGKSKGPKHITKNQNAYVIEQPTPELTIIQKPPVVVQQHLQPAIEETPPIIEYETD